MHTYIFSSDNNVSHDKWLWCVPLTRFVTNRHCIFFKSINFCQFFKVVIYMERKEKLAASIFHS